MFASGAVGTKYMNMVVTIPHSVSPYVTVYNIQVPFVGTNTRFTKLDNPDVLPTSGGNYCTGSHFNPSGDILAVTYTASPFVRFYERNGDKLTALPAVATAAPSLPSRGGNWHPNNNLFVAATDTFPRIFLAKRSATTSTRFESVSTATLFFNDQMPPAAAWGCAWNPQGTILTASLTGSPYMIAYWYDGDKFYKLDTPAITPTGATDPSGGCWSPDGSIVIFNHGTSPWITAYWVNYNGTATTFTKLANPAALPGSTPQSIGMNNTGSSISHSLYNSPYQHAYNISYNGTSTTLTRVGSFPTMSNGGGYTTAWLPDDNSFVLGAYNAPRFQYVTRSGDTFTLQLSVVPNVLIPGNTNGPGSIWPKQGNTTK